MPIYMDRHDVSEEVTAESIAHLHNEDLKVQDKFGCKGLTYWFDEERRTAFCLAEAPNEEAMIAMHEYAHGQSPYRIIEVDKTIVESFLGRIEDPEKSKNTELNIINDPAFRAVMAILIKYGPYTKTMLSERSNVWEGFKKSLSKIVSETNGRIVNQSISNYLISFTSVNNAILCAKRIRKAYNLLIHNSEVVVVDGLSIGISAGIPVTNNNGFFEDTINSAKRLCETSIAQVKVTPDVKDLYEGEKKNIIFDGKQVYALSRTEAIFLEKLIAFTENNFHNEMLNSDDFHVQLGYSKSQFYRKIKSLLKKSPNLFLKGYRLNKSLSLMSLGDNNISEIAFKIGFKSQSHFSKSFLKQYAVSPSFYIASIKSNPL